MGFYKRFIEDFAKIFKPLTNLFSRDVDFIIDNDARNTFNRIKDALIQAPILQALDWSPIIQANV